MKKEYIPYAIAGAIAVCVIYYYYYELSYISEIAQAKELIRADAKDPASVVFRNVESEGDHGGNIEVCGEYNAKNSFGAYTGYEGFNWVSNRPSHVSFARSTSENLWEARWRLSPCANNPTRLVKAISARKAIDARYQAERGDALEQYYLGMCYSTGHGVEKDYVQAYLWYSLAAQSDEPRVKHASSMLWSVRGSMTPEQIAEADELVKNWKPK